jgi:hypothetical protein
MTVMPAGGFFLENAPFPHYLQSLLSKINRNLK